MASVIKIKRNNSAGTVPSGGDLVAGELAVNTADGLLFTSSNGSDIVSLGMTAANIQAHAALANTNAAIATKASEANSLLRLSNTNAYIATKLNSSSYTTADVQAKAALANTNTQIATKASEANSLLRLSNTNARVAAVESRATSLETATTAAAIQATAALANTNDFIANRATASAAWNNATDTLTFTRGDSSTYTVALSGFPSDSVSNTYLQATFTANSVIGAQLSNTNAAIATKASEANSLLRLSNTNAYIATKLNTSSYTAADVQAKAALANTNTAIATKASEANSLLRLSNTNAYIAAVQADVNTNEADADAAFANLIDGTTAFTAINVDGGSIVAADVTVGSGKTLNVSAGTLTLAADQISGDSINGGTISTFASTGIDDNATASKVVIADALTTLSSTAVNVTGDLTVDGSMTVEGTVTYLGTTTVNVEDNLMKLSANNVADTVDTGVYGKYVDSGTKYAGYFRDATDDVFKFFDGLTAEPGATVNTGGAGYNLATIEAVIDGGTF